MALPGERALTRRKRAMREYDEILSDVLALLKPFQKPGMTLSEDTDLVADLGLDSLKVMEMLTEVEDRFDISIPLNILEQVRTVKDLAVQLQKVFENG